MGNQCSRSNKILPSTSPICPVLPRRHSIQEPLPPLNDCSLMFTDPWIKPTWYVEHELKDLIPLAPLIHNSLQAINDSATFKHAQLNNSTLTSSDFLSTQFYEILFMIIPSARRMFAPSSESKCEMLQSMITLLLDLLRTTATESNSEITRQVHDLVEFHNSIHISLNQYNMVGEALVDALEYCCGVEYWSTELAHAWYTLYSALLDIIIKVFNKSALPLSININNITSAQVAKFSPPSGILRNIEE
jgi:hemoglobin-like flavoprotein